MYNFENYEVNNILRKMQRPKEFIYPILDFGEWCDINGDIISPSYVKTSIEENGFAVTRCLCPKTANVCERWIKNWAEENYNGKTPSFKGIVTNVGHTKVMWKLRTTPSIKKVFETIYGEEDLVSSFDGFNISKPKKTNDKWCHADHPNLAIPDERICMISYQMVLSLSENDGGTVLWPDDGHNFMNVIESNPDYGYKWETVDPEIIDVNPVLVSVPPGYAVVWSSKVFHQGFAPSLKSSDRIVAYISMTPRIYLWDHEEKEREEWFRQRITTGHWCYGHFANPAPKNRFAKSGITGIISDSDITPDILALV